MLLSIADRLSVELGALRFRPPVAYVYNPLEYAREAYAAYVARFGSGPKEALFVGMNHAFEWMLRGALRAELVVI